MKLPNDARVGRIVAEAVEVVNACLELLGSKPLTAEMVAGVYDSTAFIRFIDELVSEAATHVKEQPALILSILALTRLRKCYVSACTYFAVAWRLEEAQDRDYAIMLASTKTRVKKSLPMGRMAQLLAERQLRNA